MRITLALRIERLTHLRVRQIAFDPSGEDRITGRITTHALDARIGVGGDEHGKAASRDVGRRFHKLIIPLKPKLDGGLSHFVALRRISVEQGAGGPFQVCR